MMNNKGLNDHDEDALYNSLCRLTNSSSKPKSKSKVVVSSVQYKEGHKELAFTLNEVYSTDGKGPMNDSDGKLGTKQHLFRQKIKSIGTSLKNCDISDVISIDIDPESTRLPMMCKLMIIVEGAAYERGRRVLVRDASIQVGECCLGASLDDYGKQIPIVRVDTGTSSNLTDSIKYRSSENINYETLNQHVNIKTNLISNRSKSGGSLSNLSTSFPLSVYSDDHLDLNTYYFNKDLRNRMFESHLNLLEYTSIPFYQYITRNVAMKDFTNPIQEDLYTEYSYVEKKTMSHSSSSSNLANTHDIIEVKIPIRLCPPELHRNEKTILITNDYNTNGSNSSSSLTRRSDSFRTLKNNMKRYLDEKLNRFEAEITFFDPLRQHNMNFNNYPLSYTYHFNQATSASSSSSQSSMSMHNHLKSGKSCTNLMFMQIVDGRIME